MHLHRCIADLCLCFFNNSLLFEDGITLYPRMGKFSCTEKKTQLNYLIQGSDLLMEELSYLSLNIYMCVCIMYSVHCTWLGSKLYDAQGKLPTLCIAQDKKVTRVSHLVCAMHRVSYLVCAMHRLSYQPCAMHSLRT